MVVKSTTLGNLIFSLMWLLTPTCMYVIKLLKVYIPTPPKKTVVEHTAPENWRSDDNRLADSLSRGDLVDFFACCEYYSPNKFSDVQKRLTSYQINAYQVAENKTSLE